MSGLSDELFSGQAVPGWVESGISGLSRLPEWDWTGLVEIPELASSGLAEFEFELGADGAFALVGDERVAGVVLDRLTVELDGVLSRPYLARAVRQTDALWSLGGSELREGTL